MDIHLTGTLRQTILAFLLILLPLILIGIGVIAGIENALYYILSILWFGLGIIFFGAVS
jgi:hypothetical protein